MKNSRHIPASFFNRKTLTVAKELLGCYLVRKDRSGIKKYKITEVEGYVGPHDLASHGSKGKTPRTEVMFGEGGYFYIYFIYGMYWMLNIVTEKKGYPAGILIRALEDEHGVKITGPGRLTKALNITKEFNGSLAHAKNSLWFEFPNRKRRLPNSQMRIRKTPRIGVDYAGPIWSQKHYRFLLLD